MKIAKQAPAVQKVPVYITSDKYALYYSKPILLGNVDKRGNYWYTPDGMRFVSSRNALEYLIRIRELVESEIGIESTYRERTHRLSNLGTESNQIPKLPDSPRPSPTVVLRKKPGPKPGLKQEDRRELDIILSNLGYVRRDDAIK